MRIVRPEQSWCVLKATGGVRICLQRLAMRCGYRIGELCAELGCAERYLYEVFTRDIGLAPKVWMRQERMVVARRMLTGGRTPDEVTEMLGFSSRKNFRREFQSVHGVTPSRFQLERCKLSVGRRVPDIEG